jgi:hypothetical protein
MKLMVNCSYIIMLALPYHDVQGFGGRYVMDDANVPVGRNVMLKCMILINCPSRSPCYRSHTLVSLIRRTQRIKQPGSCFCLPETRTLQQVKHLVEQGKWYPIGPSVRLFELFLQRPPCRPVASLVCSILNFKRVLILTAAREGRCPKYRPFLAQMMTPRY